MSIKDQHGGKERELVKANEYAALDFAAWRCMGHTLPHRDEVGHPTFGYFAFPRNQERTLFAVRKLQGFVLI